MVYALVRSDLVLLPTRNHGMISTRYRLLRTLRDYVDIKPYLRVDANVLFGLHQRADRASGLSTPPGTGPKLSSGPKLTSRAARAKSAARECLSHPLEAVNPPRGAGREFGPLERFETLLGGVDIPHARFARSYSPIKTSASIR